MKTEATKRVSRSRTQVVQLPEDDESILSIAAPDGATYVSRTALSPEDEEVSLPSMESGGNEAIAPLTRFLGPQLTVANPAWSADPVPQMRALQKKLVEHSLTLAPGDRGECMEALRIVENAVQLRLRFQQMRMTEEEADMKPGEGTAS
jgi:hypothetical protein